MTRDDTSPDDGPDPFSDDAAELADDAAQAAADLDRQDLRLVRLLTSLLNELRSIEDPNPRLRHAIDQAAIAICERLGRICRRDLPPDPD